MVIGDVMINIMSFSPYPTKVIYLHFYVFGTCVSL